MAKEAVLVVSVHMGFDETKLENQQAADRLEELLLELDEKHGVKVNVHKRYIQTLEDDA